MALGTKVRNQIYRFSYSLTKRLTSIPQFPNCHSFSNTANPPNFNFSNSPQPSQYRKQISLANLFQRYGFPVSELHSFLAKNKFLLNSNVSELEGSLEILSLSFKLQQNVLVSLVCGCPAVLDLRFLKKWEAGICYLGSLGSSPMMCRSVLDFSRRFQIDPDEFSRCVRVLRGLGFSDGTIGRVLEGFPGVVMMSEQELQKRMDFWSLVGIQRETIDRIYYSFPGVLGYTVENRLKPLLDEFFVMGFDWHSVKQEIVKEPRILSLELGELRTCLELLKKLKCRMPIKEEIFSQGEFQAGLAVKLRVDRLHRYGFTRRDALNILKREPRAIIYDIEDIEKKIDFLLQRMKFDIDSLVDVPEYLGVHFDKQIVPRHNVIEYLRSKGGLGFEVGLRDIIKPSRLKFYNFYVKPYPECEKMFGRFSDYVETKPRHPAGLWKIFKPPKYPESKEDLKNIKSFMEQMV